jgi:Spy/CpxP family protein refolding chaperone
MKNIYRAFILATISISLFADSSTTPTSTPGQTKAGKRLHRLAEILTLTKDEVTQAEPIFAAEASAIKTAREGLKPAYEALDAAIETNTGIAAAVAQIQPLQTQIFQARATADASFYALLTPAQEPSENIFLTAQVAHFGDLRRHCYCDADDSATTSPSVAGIVSQRVARLTILLNLTAAEAAQATAFFTTEVTAVEAAQAARQAARQSLLPAIEANNTATIAATVNQIGVDDGQIISARATAEASVYAMLTSSQQTVYAALLNLHVPAATAASAN